MGFSSILDMVESPYKNHSHPVFLLDLNLYQIIDRICRYWGEDIASFYCYLPADSACEDYRREVYDDIRKNHLYDILCEFMDRMKTRREIFGQKTEVTKELQKTIWHIKETDCYCNTFLTLARDLEQLPLHSRGMKEFRSFLQSCVTSEAFVKMQSRAAALLADMGNFSLKLVYENDKITVSREAVSGAYDHFLENCFPGQNRQMKSPFGMTADLTELEQELLKAFQKNNPDFFRKAAAFYKEYEVYADEILILFSSEIRYYLAFYRFEEKMKENGFPFAAPSVKEDHNLAACGLYDLALACTPGMTPEKIVSNDMHYEAGENFFVLTGPNQGGKTTFARSLGQLVYFSKMGLDVPALSANLHYFSEILTHFSVEESVETGRGKLKDELVRLAPMMNGKNDAKSFVVINELFTTAANYDACIMGKRVLEHFISRDCLGIYVTHLKELSEAHPRVVSLRAMTDGQGSQTFKISRNTAADQAGAAGLVNKYGLSYEQLKERLS